MSRSSYASEQYLQQDVDIAEADRRQYDDVSDDYDRRTRDAAEALADRASEVVERGHWLAKDLIGAENWVALRRRMRDEKFRFSNLLQPPADAMADYDRLSAARRDNVRQFLAGLQIDTAKLSDIYRDVSAGVAELAPKVEATPGYAAWLNSEHLDTVRSGDAPPTSGWQTFRPPFTGWQEGNDTFKYGFAVTPTHFRNEATGLVGQELRLDNNDASDFDNGWGKIDTQVAFWFTPPQTGVVEVVVEARCGQGQHSLLVIDEWGTSDSGTSQENFLMMHVLHPNVSAPSFGWMSRFNWNTDVSGNIQRHFLTQGGLYSARLFSNGPVNANQPVVIRAGTRTQDGSITNDMEINSRSTFRWAIQAVYVRIS